jgi:hypothetical protein
VAQGLLSPRLEKQDHCRAEKRVGWEMGVRIEKIITTVLNEAHGRQVEKVMHILSEGPKSFYKSYLD